MLIEHTGGIIRETQLHDSLVSGKQDPKPWQFKQFYDVAANGVELVWPYAEWDTESQPPEDIQYERLSEHLFAINFPAHVRVQGSCNLFILPHHRAYIALAEGDTSSPFAMTQTIEADWWPGQLRVIFANKKCVFEKGEPFAQAVVVSRRDHIEKQMAQSELEQRENALRYIEAHKDDYITRRMQVEGFASQDNLYERLSYLNKRDELPAQLKKKQGPQPRLKWR